MWSFSLGWTHPFTEYKPICPRWAVTGLLTAIDDPMSLVGGTGRLLRPRCTGGLRAWRPACNANAPSPVKTHHTQTQRSLGITISCQLQKLRNPLWFVFLCVIVSPTFVGLASNIIWVMEAGGRIGLNGASSVADGGCSFTFMDLCEMKGRVSNLLLCL